MLMNLPLKVKNFLKCPRKTIQKLNNNHNNNNNNQLIRNRENSFMMTLSKCNKWRMIIKIIIKLNTKKDQTKDNKYRDPN